MKENQTKLLKIDVICPFCLYHTDRWKMIECKLERVLRDGLWTLEWEAVNIKEANKFEQKILKEHLDNCVMKSYLTDYAKALYGL